MEIFFCLRDRAAAITLFSGVGSENFDEYDLLKQEHDFRLLMCWALGRKLEPAFKIHTF